ncbi:hypothetical protein E2320_008933 [Naja naja]|nr:hypothetical protein E2320_008933 [Naja naja]
MAVGFSNRCWSSSRFEKLSLVKCSLQRKEYLVGIQLSRCTAFNHWISRFESFNGNLQKSIKAETTRDASRRKNRPTPQKASAKRYVKGAAGLSFGEHQPVTELRAEEKREALRRSTRSKRCASRSPVSRYEAGDGQLRALLSLPLVTCGKRRPLGPGDLCPAGWSNSAPRNRSPSLEAARAALPHPPLRPPFSRTTRWRSQASHTAVSPHPAE